MKGSVTRPSEVVSSGAPPLLGLHGCGPDGFGTGEGMIHDAAKINQDVLGPRG